MDWIAWLGLYILIGMVFSTLVLMTDGPEQIAVAGIVWPAMLVILLGLLLFVAIPRRIASLIHKKFRW